MQLFATPELCVAPRPGFSTAVIEVVDRVLDEASDTREAIRAALPHVVALARRNVEGLPVRVLADGAA